MKYICDVCGYEYDAPLTRRTTTHESQLLRAYAQLCIR